NAATNLEKVRYDLEIMRTVGEATKDFVAKSIALGDGLSGMTGAAALQWQVERGGINKQVDKFKQTYDTEHNRLMESLRNALDKYDACESKYGERDWYGRFAFLYYQFMFDKYKRSF